LLSENFPRAIESYVFGFCANKAFCFMVLGMLTSVPYTIFRVVQYFAKVVFKGILGQAGGVSKVYA
jgi:hypothetical protein